MSAVPRDISRLIYDRAGGSCEYCGRSLRRHDMTVDHWMPRWREGGEDSANLRCACHGCNHAKGRMHPDEWAPIAARRRAAQAARQGESLRRLSRVELLMRCAPLWPGRRGGEA